MIQIFAFIVKQQYKFYCLQDIIEMRTTHQKLEPNKQYNSSETSLN